MGDNHTHRDEHNGQGQAGPDLRLLEAVDEVIDETLPDGLAGRVEGHVETFAAHLRQGLLAASTAVGLEVMAELMDAEVDELAGPKGKHDPDRTAYRHGSDDGAVTLGGRRVDVTRPRVRRADGDGEVPLATYATFAETDLMAEHMVGAMLAGVSTRRYADAALEPVDEQTQEASSSTSRSSVSRKFVHATTDRLNELCARPLEGTRWAIMFIDGFTFGQHTLVAALGVTDDGTKVPVGVVEGSTENAAVCTRLVADLADRGLDCSDGVLFVIDGSKALTKAIRDVFAGNAVIQRCQRHKEENILEHLPEDQRPWVRRKLREAWAVDDADAAKRQLTRLAATLDKKRPGAAASLREGLDETLTIIRLGITGTLRKTVFSTNPVESMISICRDHASNVKRWRGGHMALRWAAAGMLSAESQFRRVKGYRDIPRLLDALEDAVADEPGTLDLAVSVTA